jgi:hypothetical protein
MITDETILQIFINQNQKIMSARLNSQKFLTSATVDYILNRTSFLPTEYTIRERIIVIKNGWQEHPKCIVCGENTKFTGGSFTRFCSYSCSNKNTARARVSKMNTVKNNTNLFTEGFTEGKGIIDVCRENNINYKRARGFLHQLGIEAPSKFRNKTSSGQREILDYVRNELNLEAEDVYIENKEIDIFIKSKNFGIEYNGTFWHNDTIRPKNHLLEKSEFMASKGINLIHIFDTEWLHKKEICKSIISSRLGIYKEKLFARKCDIKELTSKEYSNFVERCHIQGKRNSSVRLGLFYNERLVAVMGFNKLKEGYEMTRFCCELYVSIVGGAEKLFRHFIKKHKDVIVVSFSDRRLFTGRIYEKLGFVLKGISKPNYFYFKKGTLKLESRVKYQKHKLHTLLKNYEPSLSEIENMRNNGYLRIWDCGNKVFKYG